MSISLPHNWLTARVISLAVGALALGTGLSTWVLHSSLTATTCCSKAVPDAPRTQDFTFLRPGDLVFRRGESILSGAVLVLDPGALYSHVGIVVRTAGELSVVHSVVDEAPNRAGSVRADRIRAFLAPERAAAVAIYRLRENSSDSAAKAELASRIAADYASRHVPFDSDFDLDSSDAVYCTELIWRAYRGAGVELVTGELPTISFCLKRRKAILPSTLQNSVKLRLIWRKKENN